MSNPVAPASNESSRLRNKLSKSKQGATQLAIGFGVMAIVSGILATFLIFGAFRIVDAEEEAEKLQKQIETERKWLDAEMCLKN